MTTDIRCIVVHLDGPERAQERLLLARQLAVEHGAALRVHYAAVTPSELVPIAGESAALVMEAALAMEEDRRQRAHDAFKVVLREPGPSANWSLSGGLEPAREFAHAAMYGDLMVLGQHDPSAAGFGAPADFVEAVLAQSGRPALVVPCVGPAPGAFSTVAVAWKETPEAARAVVAALPFLRRAASVHILAWGAEPQGGHLPRLAQYLALHGVLAERHHEPPEDAANLGESILSRCDDLSADLLVMGCYGHGRAREWAVGGASRTMLLSMTLPVLMTH